MSLSRIHVLGIIMTVICIAGFQGTVLGEDLLEKGIQLFNMEKYSEAMEIFKSYSSDNPDDAESVYYLGRIYFAEEDHKKAVKFLEKAVELDNDSSRNHYQLAMAYAERAGTAGAFKKIGFAKKMKKTIIKAVDLDPENMPARITLFQFYLQAPGMFGGSTEKAMIQLEEIRKRDTVLGDLAKVEICNKNKDYNQAAELLKVILSEWEGSEFDRTMFGNLSSSVNGLGYIFLNDGEFEKAIEVFRMNTDRFPQSVNAWDSLAEAFLKKGDKAIAAEYYQKTIDLNPRNNEYYENLYKGACKSLERIKTE
ncbi:tetratricopeptide repeat protein [bacterium]|nr:tetratricopeptide repeat protein [bacterium]